jgi:hypothetical protein
MPVADPCGCLPDSVAESECFATDVCEDIVSDGVEMNGNDGCGTRVREAHHGCWVKVGPDFIEHDVLRCIYCTVSGIG